MEGIPCDGQAAREEGKEFCPKQQAGRQFTPKLPLAAPQVFQDTVQPASNRAVIRELVKLHACRVAATPSPNSTSAMPVQRLLLIPLQLVM